MSAQEKTHRVRRAVSIVLIVIVSILAPLVVTSGWAITTVTNTDRFVATMSALGSDTTITAYVAQQGAQTVVTKLDVSSELQKKLPSQVSFLAPIIASQVQTQLTTVFTTVLNSPKFQAAWDAKIRLLHTTFVKLMTTSPTKLEHASQLALDFTPEVLKALDQLDAKGIHVLDPVRTIFTGDQRVLVTLAQDKQFSQVQWYFNFAVKLRWVLPLLTLALGAIAVLADKRRRRAGTWLSIGIASSCLVMLVILAFAKRFASTHAPTPPDVAVALFSTLTAYLRWELRVAVLLGALTALTLWVTGPGERAKKVRAAIASGSTAAARKVGGAMGEDSAGRLESGTTGVLSFVGHHGLAFAWGGVGIAAFAVATWVDSLGGLIWAVVPTAVWFALVMWLRRLYGSGEQPAPESPAAPEG